MNPEEISKLLDHHRRIVQELEAELELAREGREGSWVPQKFYTAYYVLAGMVIGMGAAWITLILNAIGSFLIHGDAVRLMRVYATFFAGEEAMTTNRAAILMLSVGIHTLTGAVCGAPIHVVLSRLYPQLGVVKRALAGVVLGVVMWAVNFYGVLSWLQPVLVQGSFILDETPVLIAIANHVAFAVLVVVFQPLGAFQSRLRVAPAG